MIRTAIVGVSGYGRWHLMMAIDQTLLGRLQLVGATIINPESEVFVCQRLRQLGVPIFATYEEMIRQLAGRIDLCLLPTGIQYHAPMTIAALRAGANVVVEKPLAATLQDIDAIRAEEQRTGRWVAVGFQDLYVPETHAIKRDLLGGRIGQLQRITAVGQWPRSHNYYQRNNWAGRVRVDDAWVLDSPVNNALAHYLNLCLFWAGTAETEAAQLATIQAGLYRAQAIDSFDTISLRLGTTTGVLIDFHGTHSGTKNAPPEITLQGSEGRIQWVYDRHYTIRRPGRTPEFHRLLEFLGARMAVGDAAVRKCTEPATFVCSTTLARTHTQVINLLHEHFPIIDVPADALEQVTEGNEPFTRIKGIDAAIDQAVTTGHLLGRGEYSWAVTPEIKVARDYERFDRLFPAAGTPAP
jgi:predicted dehydrogenase